MATSHSYALFLLLFPLCLIKLAQIDDTALLPLHVLLLHGSRATITVAGYVSALDADSYTFELNLSLRICAIPGFALLTVSATFLRKCDDDEKVFDMPRLHTLVCTTGFLVNVEGRLARMLVSHVVSLPDYNHAMEDAEVLGV